MATRYLKYSLILLLWLPQLLLSQDNIRREVKLYNPFKPTLAWENKLNFSPVMGDTSLVVPMFEYNISPQAFMPEYTIRTIGAARLEPDPLERLYKSYLNIGFGNYFSPVAELSISSERSRDKIIGFYAAHNSSFGKIKMENDDEVFAGYMDNKVSLYGTKLFRRSALTGNMDFDHTRRYAYGYDYTNLLPDEQDKDSLKIDYFNPSASISIYSTRLDSSHIDYNIRADYSLIMQNVDFFQHNPGIEMDFGYSFKSFYASAELGYELFIASEAIGNNPQHLVTFNPSIARKSKNWAFKVGADIKTFSRDIFDGSGTSEYKTNLYVYPDVKFQFVVIPSFVVFYVALDGELKDNRALNVIANNPWIVNYHPLTGVLPAKQLYRMNPTNNVLRFKGGILGSAGEHTNYKLTASYTLFEDMLFYTSDTLAARGFYPVYDGGELMNIYAEFNSRINDKFSLGIKANFYSYQLELEEYPWYMPSWDGQISLKYNLRNKILAHADLFGLSERFGSYGPSLYTGEMSQAVRELPIHLSLNLGVEYRYTKILSFWTSLNNISNKRYYEYGFYPSQRFLFMAGFTYSM